MTTKHTPGRLNFADSAPAQIWLGIFCEDEDAFFPADHEGICWAEDQFADMNVGYVREDIANKTKAQRDELLAALKYLRDAFLGTSIEVQADGLRKARAAIARAEGAA